MEIKEPAHLQERKMAEREIQGNNNLPDKRSGEAAATARWEERNLQA